MGDGLFSSGENISYGDQTPMETLLNLAIDADKPDRGHRLNIFSKEFFYMACYTGPHDKFKKMTVINFNGNGKPIIEEDIVSEIQIPDIVQEQQLLANQAADEIQPVIEEDIDPEDLVKEEEK